MEDLSNNKEFKKEESWHRHKEDCKSPWHITQYRPEGHIIGDISGVSQGGNPSCPYRPFRSIYKGILPCEKAEGERYHQ